jgi:hypothetical protein
MIEVKTVANCVCAVILRHRQQTTVSPSFRTGKASNWLPRANAPRDKGGAALRQARMGLLDALLLKDIEGEQKTLAFRLLPKR